MDIQIARTNMIKQQIRTSGIVDDNLLATLASVPREAFVPAPYYNMAYADMNIPLTHEQCMLSPTLEAKILQAVAIQPHERVLEIGTGTGYFTTLLAKLATHVVSVDYFEDFIEIANENISQFQINNVSLHVGNGSQGWEPHKNFDVIIITGALPFLPQAFEQQLTQGGRIFAVLGENPIMHAYLMQRINTQQLQMERLFETTLPPLLDAPKREAFVF
jgi:protein-L-isoaspartate(D-aspartate) O-methyltransferase